MSEQDTGSKDRATVALVYRTVDDLGKLISAQFEAVHIKLDELGGLPGRVDGMERVLTDHERRILVGERERAKSETRLSEQEKDRRSFWRDKAPQYALSLLSLALAAAAVFHLFG